MDCCQTHTIQGKNISHVFHGPEFIFFLLKTRHVYYCSAERYNITSLISRRWGLASGKHHTRMPINKVNTNRCLSFHCPRPPSCERDLTENIISYRNHQSTTTKNMIYLVCKCLCGCMCMRETGTLQSLLLLLHKPKCILFCMLTFRFW